MSKHTETLSLVALCGAAVFIRLWLAWHVHVATIDTAVVGLMAMDILDGQRPLFFAGQRYMGALEAYLVAFVFRFVDPGHFTLAWATTVSAVAWIVATHFFFRMAIGPRAGLAAATISAFPGWVPLWYTTVPYGGYPQTYFFGMLLLILGLSFIRHEGRGKGVVLHASACAIVAGIAVWTNLQIVPYLMATGLAACWVLIRKPFMWRYWIPYFMVPFPVLIAFLPQYMVTPAHADPPLYDLFSLSSLMRSIRALPADLAQCLLYGVPSSWLNHIVVFLYTFLLIGAIGLTLGSKVFWARHTNGMTWLVLAMLAVFAVTYFPHPMSGNVPRYLISAVILLSSWCLAIWTSHDFMIARRIGWCLAGLLCVYNVTGAFYESHQRAQVKSARLEAFDTIIHVARDQEWTSVMHIGSETEGYGAARLTFSAQRRVLFSSAFSDRFLRHQLAWEFAEEAPVMAPRNHDVYIRGSYAAMHAKSGDVINAGPYVLYENPVLERRTENILHPDRINNHSDDVDSHPLFDRHAETHWPITGNDDESSLFLYFEQPVLLTGLRAIGSSISGLPYRYEIRVKCQSGDWKLIQESTHRIATSYISGNRIYFRGHYPWMDIRFDPVNAMALEWRILPGILNPSPPSLAELYILGADNTKWTGMEERVRTMEDVIRQHPSAPVTMERGLMALFHRYVLDDDIRDRIPLPYNPRYASTQPGVKELKSGDHLVVIESCYLTEVERVMSQMDIEHVIVHDDGIFAALLFHTSPAADQRLLWHGFTLLQK